MKFDNFKNDKGVAGLTILMSLVTMLFVIGLLVMIFALMGGEISDTDSIKASDTATATQTSLAMNLSVPVTLTACDSANQGVYSSFGQATNSTLESIDVANFSFSGCTVNVVSGSLYDNTTISNLTYTYTHAGTGWDVINETTTSIGTVTDWFDIFIVIGAMVVLILLTVIIITAIRGSGLMGANATSKSGGTSGSA